MNFTLTDAVLVALISSVMALMLKLIDGYISRRKWPTEQAAMIAEAAAQIADDQRESIKIQRGDIDELKRQLRLAEVDLARYRQDLEQLTITIHKVDQERADLKAEVKRLRDENKALRKRDTELTHRIRHLEKIIREAGLPVNGEGDG